MQTQSMPAGWISFSIALIAASAAFGLAALPDNSESGVTGRSEEAMVLPPQPKIRETDRRIRRAVFFERSVEPEITLTDERNRQAIARCVSRIKSLMDRYHRGVAPFADDLTSISTRFGIIRRMPGDWWNEDERIEQYVSKKFEQHLFSERSLATQLGEILNAFRNEIDANQKQMLASVRASLSSADMPEVDMQTDEHFFGSIAQSLQSDASRRGLSSVQNAMIVLLFSEAGGFAARSVFAGLLTRFGTTAVVGAAAGAGSTAGAAATGAGGGTVAGPAGTVVGLGVGLVVGLAIDWWMTEKFQIEMSKQLHLYLDSLEEALLVGTVSAAGAASRMPHSGLSNTLPQLCDQLNSEYRNQFYLRIVGD